MIDDVKKSDKAPNPVLYAGLKWYDLLAEKMRVIDVFIMRQDYHNWLLSLHKFVSATAPFMAKTAKEEIEKEINFMSVRVANFMQFQDRLGRNRLMVEMKLRTDMMNLQTKVSEATKHLMNKTSEGESDELDFTMLSRGG